MINQKNKYAHNEISFLGYLFFAYFIFIIFYAYTRGNLPVPFHNVPNDLFMDFYNVNLWSNDPAKYTDWKSIYPPLTFILAKELNLYNYSIFLLYFLYLLSIYLNFLIVKKNLPNNILIKVGYILFFAFCMPVLYLIERGNYLIIAYCIFLMMLINKNETKFIFFTALLINLKTYFILFIFFVLKNKDLKNLFLLLLFSGFIFLFSYILLNDKNAYLFIKNSINFSSSNSTPTYQAINYQFNFDLLVKIASTKFNFPFAILIYSNFKIFCLFLYFLTLYKFKFGKDEFMFYSILLLLVSSHTFGGYLAVFLLPFVVEYSLKNYYFFIMIFLFIPFDFVIYVREIGLHPSFWTPNSPAHHFLLISFLGIAKPFLTLLLFFKFTFDKFSKTL